MEFVFLSSLSFLFGFFQKIADAHDEHGLRWFHWANLFFGIIWWIIGGYLINYSEVLFVTYMSLNFYWIYKLKFDYMNHAVSLIIMLFLAFLSNTAFPYIQIVWLLIAYIIIDIIKHSYPKITSSFFFRYKLHFFLVPLIYSIAIANIYGFSTVVFNLAGTFVANRLFKLKRGV